MNIAFTICTANYLPYAKALADTFTNWNRDDRFIIALIDDYGNIDASFFLPHQLLTIPRLPINQWEHLNRSYDIFELSCALKPFVAEHILKTNEKATAIFYFDSDILIFGSLEKAAKILQDHPLVITPHVAALTQEEDQVEVELNMLRTGSYNGGFFGVSKSDEGLQFLAWWKERLTHYCFNDLRKGLFVDQLWLNLAPVYFKDTFVLYDPGYNMAYWNFAERTLSIEQDKKIVNGSYPLVFFHFSGYNIRQPNIISKHKLNYTFEKFPYRALFDLYRELALANNRVDYFSLPVTMGKPHLTKFQKKVNSVTWKFKKIFRLS